jgi:hypothetical protein
LHELVKATEEELMTACAAIVGRMEEVADRMVRLEVVDWGYYLLVLGKVLVAPLTTAELERVVKHSLLGAL